MTPKKKTDTIAGLLPVRIAVLIDGGFFLKRYNQLYNKDKSIIAQQVADDIYTIAHSHVGKENYQYKIFYYDCLPFDKIIYLPILYRIPGS